MRLIGLTGGIASGKSTVAAWLSQAGLPVLEADDYARQVVAPGSPLLVELASRFGPDILTPEAELNRARLAALIFADDQVRREVEALMHPVIRRAMHRDLDALRACGVPVAVVSVPLLIESGWHEQVDVVWVVDAAPAQQLERLMARNHLSEAEALARIRVQVGREERLRHADVIIDNGGNLEATRRQVEEHLHRQLAQWGLAGHAAGSGCVD